MRDRLFEREITRRRSGTGLWFVVSTSWTSSGRLPTGWELVWRERMLIYGNGGIV